jgi:hypothetical protein
MAEIAEYVTVRIPGKPWYVWTAWCALILWILFWCEVAIGSWQEREYQACIIAVVMSALSLGLAVGFAWFKQSRNTSHV